MSFLGGLGAAIFLASSARLQAAPPDRNPNTRPRPNSRSEIAPRARPELAWRTHGKLPLVFERNQGQADAEIHFLARGAGHSIYLTTNEAVLTLPGSAPLRIHPIGAQGPQRVEAALPTAGISNYFIGNDPSKWKTDVPHYREVLYSGVYPGVDMSYYGDAKNLEFDFRVAAWADPAQIQVEYQGAEAVRIDSKGDLVIRTAGGDIVQRKPRAYQHLGVCDVEVNVGYRVTGPRRTGFTVSRHRLDKDLVIDPVLGYSIYLGGSGADQANGIAVDASGSAYLTGMTASLNFPAVDAAQPTQGGTQNAFVTKLSADGSTVLYSTYLGGGGIDSGNGIAVDTGGNAYITGNTTSSNFPLINSYQGSLHGAQNAFVTKLAPTGAALVYSTYLGGSGSDQSNRIAVDTSGFAYITGNTTSTDFPLFNAYQSSPPAYGYGPSAFITKFSASGASLEYSTYFAFGSSGNSIALDSSGNAYVTGSTAFGDLPVTSNAIQANWAGGGDAFVATFSADGSTLLYSTYLGGSSDDSGQGIALDGHGDIYVAGFTASSNFPTVNAVQPTQGAPPVHGYYGGTNAFVSKLSSGGSQLVYSTYLGGAAGGCFNELNSIFYGGDEALSIAVDDSGDAYVTGLAGSANFPVTAGALQPTLLACNGNAFLTELSTTGSSIVYSTFLGSSLGGSAIATYGDDIAVNVQGNVYVAGSTISGFPAQNLYDGGSSDAFVTMFVPSNGTCSYSVTPATITVGPAGASGSIAVTTTTGCAWIAQPGESWITVSPPDPVSGSGVVEYSVSIIPSATTPRSGTLTVASQPVAVSQSAGCVLSSVVPAFGSSFSDITAPFGPQAQTIYMYVTPNDPENCTQTTPVPTCGDCAQPACTDTSSAVEWASFLTDPYPPGFVTGEYCEFNEPACYCVFGCAFIPGTPYGSFHEALSLQQNTGPQRSGNITLTRVTLQITQAGGGTSPGTATHFLVSAPSSATAGLPIQFTVTALDSSNNTVTAYTDPVHFTSTDPAATLPGDGTLSNGVGTFSASLVTPGAVTLTASDPLSASITGTSGSIQVSQSTAGLRFISMPPCRVVDTRDAAKPSGFGPPSLLAGGTRSFTIPSGPCGIPATAQAYSLNVTVVPEEPLSYLTVWPTGQSQPFVSTLNSLDGAVQANAAIIPAGTGGAISVFATDNTNLVLDINGYFVPNTVSSALGFYPMTPCRLVDTRPGAPSTIVTGALTGGTSTALPILSSSCNVPATAAAYSLNVTLVPPGPVAYLTVYPTGESLPVVSTMNDLTGTVAANAAIAPAGTGGSIEAYVTQTTNLVVDINGYFAPVAEGALSLYALPPCRVLDTRNPTGTPPFEGTINVDVIGSGCGGTSAAQAYVFNATVVPQGPLGYLTLWPQGSVQPVVSTLNAENGDITSNMAIVPTSNTEISAYASNTTFLVLDLFGYFAP